MPFSNYKQFNSDAMITMTAAYDAAIARLGIPKDDPRIAKLANIIVTFASQGVQDAATLCDQACAEINKG